MAKCKFPRLDLGLIWGKYLNIWNQIGSIAGLVQLLMMIGVFYTTTLNPKFQIPFWLYLVIIIIGGLLLILFVLKIGLSGYFRYFSKHTDISEVNNKVDELAKQNKLIIEQNKLIIEHLNIEDKYVVKKVKG